MFASPDLIKIDVEAAPRPAVPKWWRLTTFEMQNPILRLRMLYVRAFWQCPQRGLVNVWSYTFPFHALGSMPAVD